MDQRDYKEALSLGRIEFSILSEMEKYSCILFLSSLSSTGL